MIWSGSAWTERVFLTPPAWRRASSWTIGGQNSAGARIAAGYPGRFDYDSGYGHEPAWCFAGGAGRRAAADCDQWDHDHGAVVAQPEHVQRSHVDDEWIELCTRCGLRAVCHAATHVNTERRRLLRANRAVQATAGEHTRIYRRVSRRNTRHGQCICVFGGESTSIEWTSNGRLGRNCDDLGNQFYAVSVVGIRYTREADQVDSCWLRVSDGNSVQFLRGLEDYQILL